MSEKLVLIDGHSILNRAFYGVPDLTNSEGIHTNAIYGFLNIMFKILDEEKPQYLIVAFDLSAPTFRHKMYEAYKGTRKGMPDELRQQVPLIKEVLGAMGILCVSKEGYEADDLLGTIAKKSEKEGLLVSIISGDRDILQIATDNIKIRIPKTKKGITEIENYNTKDVIELYGVTPKEFIDVKALMGDASDNIPGAPGIGEKTAGAIIQKYHSIENAFENIDEITPNKAKNSLKENYELVKLSKELATININAPIEYDLKNATLDNMFNEKSYELYKKYNFKTLLKRFTIEPVVTEPSVYSNIKVIDELEQAEKLFEELKTHDEVAFSIVEENDELYGISFAYDKDNVSFVWVLGFVTQDYLLEKLSLLSQNITLICIDLKKLLKFVMLPENSVKDIQIAAYLLNPLKESYDYDELSKDYLGEIIPSKAEILGKRSIRDLAFIKEYDLVKVAALSANTIFRCYSGILDKLSQTNQLKLYNEIELPLIYVLDEMEKEGIRVDANALKKYGEVLALKINALEAEIYSLAGEEFNINSPKQLGVILFEKLQLPSGKKTKSGYSTAADILEKLAGDYPIVSKILEYRQLAKLKSTYADGLANYISSDGRIHGKFNQTITATGRISSTEPNLQNIPIRMEAGRKIREVFVPKDGYVFVDADYSQIELRILAHMSGDEKLIESYNSSLDIHAITASLVFKTPLEEVTKEQRSNAKAVNFGIVYGISSFGLSQDLSISRKEAQNYIEQYFETYPSIKAYIDGIVLSAKEKGYAETMYGRRRPIPELNSSNFMQKSFGERIAMNSPIQGTAADIIKIAMINVRKALKANGLKSKLILQVHDELLVEAAADEVEIVKQLVIDNMKEAAKLKVSLEVSALTGNNWLEAH